MPNIEISVIKKAEGSRSEVTETDGYLLLYLDNNTVKMKGQMDLKSFTPILTKILLEKMAGK